LHGAWDRAVAQVAGQVRTHQDHRYIEHRHIIRWPLPVFSRWNSAADSANAPVMPVCVVDRRRPELDLVDLLVPVIAMMPEVAG